MWQNIPALDKITPAMLTSKRVVYGLRILYDLASSKEGFQSAHTLASTYQVPEAFLRRILMDLRRAGFVEAQKGRVGGYKLARRPEDIKVKAVVQTLEPEAMELVFGRVRGRGANLQPVNKSCPTWPFWERLESVFLAELERATLADLLRQEKRR